MPITSRSRHALAAASMLVAAGAQANSYTIVDLSDCDCIPAAVEGGGVIVANGIDRVRAKVLRGDGWRDLPAHSHVTAISKEGDAAGFYPSGAHGGKGAIWPRRGNPVVVEPPPGGGKTLVYGVNKDGDAAGSYRLDGHWRCFRRWSGLEAEDLGLPNTGKDCEVSSINNAGSVATTVTLSDGHKRAFYYGFSGFFGVGLLPGANYSEAWAMDRGGSIVGTSGKEGGGSHGFVWLIGPNPPIDLDPQGTYYKSVATSIAPDKNGWIVGYAQACADCEQIAVRSTFDVFDMRLVPLISEVSNVGDWKALSVATGVDTKGIIVGWGDNGVRSDAAFMLIPEEAALPSGR